MSDTEAEQPAMARFHQARRAKGSLQRALQDQLVLDNLEIADAAANAYTAQGRDPADLRQVAYLGLIKAVRRFDPSVGTHFPAFAVPTVHGEIKRYLRDNCWVVRPPRQLQDLRTVVAKTQPQLAQRLGRQPSLAELGAELGHDARLIAEALNCQSSLRPESLDAPDGGQADPEGQLLGDVISWEDPGLDLAENMSMLRSAVAELSAPEKELLFWRFFHEESQQRIGERLGMTQMQVSRLLARVLVKLQQRLLEPAAAGSAPEQAGPQARSA